jgi:ribose 5-phosphate isomerase A
MTIYERALELVPDGAVLGLGSGRAATAFVKALAGRVQAGRLKVRGVPTSQATADLAGQLGIPLTTLTEVETLDVCVDGADEVDPRLNLIKGYGRALVREKIVAASARQLVILVTPEKLVPRLGARGKLPVEVVEFGLPLCERRLRDLGLSPVPFRQGERLFLSDNGNPILDCGVGPLDDPARLERELCAIPGVVGTGLFLGLATCVLVGQPDHFTLIEERQRPA